MSADSSRSVEPFRGVDCRPERQGRERANARGAHHQPADWFVPDNVEGPFGQLGELAQHRDENLQQRLDRPREAFFAGDQIAGVSNEVFSARGSELQAGFAQDSANHVLDRPHLVENRAARHEKRAPGTT